MVWWTPKEVGTRYFQVPCAVRPMVYGLIPERKKASSVRVEVMIASFTMVGISECDDVIVPCVEPGHVHCEVVGLRARVHKEHIIQRLRKGCRKPLSVLVDLGVEVDGSGVPQGVYLALQSLIDLRVTVAYTDRHNTSKKIKVPEMEEESE